ncbi:uncharacterized protein KQ657_004209 [Scheffersomyces spartinae]|uniref:Uncharacterized protein n=1 Tax=Scheffersomyces spartinae TaxID=45513 RepID=A0A9P7VC53_9ASCO|nr:uncharacterized protein KQ657_004209 [Scheffersomyces spartinae]KAG7195093.1 hypothetical protein KQ657_004209 [Scheffersomyces spartinae]
MFRRKHRTTHQPAYTGVNNPPPPTNAPNNHARAAALAIGNNNATTKPMGVTRSPSMQYNIVPRTNSTHTKAPSKNHLLNRQQQQQQHHPLSPPVTQYQSSGSLLKRGSTISGSSSDDFHNFAGNTGASGPILLDSNTVDDSFTDSYFEEVNDANRRDLHDLRLAHKPTTSTKTSQKKKAVGGSLRAGSIRTGSLGSASGINNNTSNGGDPPGTVKMVKKYVPTPSGIKVIEVPEATLKKEMARSNSIRSGLNVSRAGSLTLRKSSQGSLNGSRIPRSGSMGSIGAYTPSSRVSSLVKQAPTSLPPMTELSGLEGSTETQEKEYHDLQQQIDHEKKLAHELAKKKKEYEHFKALRLQMQKDLEVLREELTSSPEANNYQPNLNPNSTDPVLTDPVINMKEDQYLDHKTVPTTSTSLEYTLNPTMDPKSIHIIPDGSDHTGGGTDETLQATSNDAHLYIHESPFASRDQLDEIKVIEQFEDSKEENVLEVPDITFDNSYYEGHEHDDDDDDEDLKPKFQDSPEVIEEPLSTQFSNDTLPDHLGAPPQLVAEENASSAHSLTSAESYESPHRTKKPMKSAMKSSSSLNKGNKEFTKAKQTAAHEAYLSLTTAENTRLNSKLSANQLSPTKGMVPGTAAAAAGGGSPVTTPKRMPLSLRKSQVSAQQQQQQQMVKSLRPQASEHGHGPYPPPSGRTLRKQSPHPHPTYVQPMPPHPALMPNYKSSSKVRAAELYEKANLRPISVQQPLERKSSYSKLPEKQRPMSMAAQSSSHPHHHEAQPLSRVSSQATTVQRATKPPVRQHRTTLRSSSAQVGGPLPVQYGSRFNDSDGEDMPSTSKPGFNSRFHDSDDDLPLSSPQQDHHNNYHNHYNEIQDVSFDSKTSKNTKEKKKFGGKLRKLFGKH